MPASRIRPAPQASRWATQTLIVRPPARLPAQARPHRRRPRSTPTHVTATLTRRTASNRRDRPGGRSPTADHEGLLASHARQHHGPHHPPENHAVAGVAMRQWPVLTAAVTVAASRLGCCGCRRGAFSAYDRGVCRASGGHVEAMWRAAPEGAGDLPRAFRTADLWLIHAADCCSRYSSWTCCGVRY
jgi:hypothetical protein